MHINLLKRYYERGDANSADFRATISCIIVNHAIKKKGDEEAGVPLLDTADEAPGDSGLDLTPQLKNKEAMAGIHSKLAHLHSGQQESVASLPAKFSTIFVEGPRVCLVLKQDI